MPPLEADERSNGLGMEAAPADFSAGLRRDRSALLDIEAI
jgi:hypothetical protein